jgi:hypothetical protein
MSYNLELFKQCFNELEAEKAKLLRQVTEERIKHEAENAKLRSRIKGCCRMLGVMSSNLKVRNRSA